MGKALLDVGAVIVGVALIATGIGAAAGAGLLGAEAAGVATAGGTLTLFGVSTTTLLEIGAATTFVGELMTKPKLTGAGSAQQFKADPNAAIPVIAGRFGSGGNIVYETTSGGSNKAKAGAAGNEYLTFCVVHSALGPIKDYETLKFNDTILNFAGQNCTGGYIPSDVIGAYNVPYHNNGNNTYENDQYNDHAWQNLQLGAVPTPYFAPPAKLLTESGDALTEWDSTHGLSNFAASFLTIVYDQTVYTGGVPKPVWTLSGHSLYDPRLDSTYPGGAGPQRWLGPGAASADLLAARETWAYSQNPFIHALNYALGYYLPDGQTGLGALYLGAGVPMRGVDIDAFVACANIADANSWIIGMQWGSDDDPWSVLTTMLQAGGGQPIDRDGRISCIINTPLTSLGTISNDDLQGSVSVDTTTAMRDRLNRVYPRFHSELHSWDMVPVVAPITGESYLAEDGRVIAKQVDYEGVTQVNQACQLAAYDLANTREGIVATLPCKPRAANYRVGDCITVDIDVANLTNLKMMVVSREPDFTTGAVALTCRSETDAKHPFAMGVSGVAPPTPTITGVDPSYLGAPLPDFWATGALELTDADTGESRGVIQVTGSAADNIYAQTLLVRWRAVSVVDEVVTPLGDGSWTNRSFPASQGQFQLDLNPGTYDVQIAYTTINGAYPSVDADWLDLGIETVGGSTAANAANVGGYTAAQIAAAVEAIGSNPGVDDSIPDTLPAPSVTFTTALDAGGATIVTMVGTTVASSDLNIAGYEFGLTLDGGTQSIFPTTLTSFSWQVPEGQSYALDVRAVKYAGARGEWSTAATGTTATDTTPPNPPNDGPFVVTGGLESNFLQWVNDSALDLDHVEVWAFSSDLLSSANQIGTVAAAPNTVSSYVDVQAPVGVAEYYWLRSVDTSGNPSAFTAAHSGTASGVQASQIIGLVTSSQIQSVVAAQITGILATSNIPGIDASKIVSGTLTSALVPTVNLQGEINSTQLQNGAVLASKLASGASGNLIGDPTFLDLGYWGNSAPLSVAIGASNFSDPCFTQLGVQRAVFLESEGGGSSPDTFNFVYTPAIPIDAGKTYRVGALYGIEGGFNGLAYVQVIYFDGTGAFIDGSAQGLQGVDYRSASSGIITTNLIDGLLVAPGNAATMAFRPGVVWGDNTPAGFVWMSTPVLQPAVDAGAIVAGAITAQKISTADLYANNIGAQIIQAGTLSANVLQAGSVTTNQIAAGTIVATNIAVYAIGAGQLAAGAVTAGKIAAGAVTASSLAIGQFGNNLVLNGGFGTGDLSGWTSLGGEAAVYGASGPYSTDEVAFLRASAGEGTYSNAFKVNPGSTYLIQFTYGGASQADSGAYFRLYYRPTAPANGVYCVNTDTPAHIFEGQPIPTGWQDEEIVWTAPGGAGWVSVVLYNTSTVTSVGFTDITFVEQLDGVNIANGAITGQQVAAATITGTNVAAYTLTAQHIAAAAITGDRIAANTLTGTNVQAGSLSADRLQAGSLTSTQIQAGGIVAASLNVSQLSAISENVGTLTAGLLTNGSGETFLDLNNARAQFANTAIFNHVIRIGTLGGNMLLWGGSPSVGIGSESSSGASFYIDANGNAYFDGVLAGGTVTTASLAGYAVTNGQEMDQAQSTTLTGSGSQAANGSGSTPVKVGDWTFPTDGYPFRTDVNVGFSNTSGDHDQNVMVTVYIDGALVKTYFTRLGQNSGSISGGSKEERYTFFRVTGVGAGSHDLQVYASWLTGSGAGDTQVYICNMGVTEYKDQ